VSAGIFTRPRHRGELAAVLIGGAAGAGAVLLASRQDVAQVIVRAPRPLPDTVTAVTAQDVRPAIAALAVAALASLAATIATRGWLRRLTGLATIALGSGIAAIAAGQVTAAAALAAADRSGAAPASGSGAGTAAGSVTAGGGAAGVPGSLAGLPVHVALGGSGWRAVMIAGAILVAAAGMAVVVRAARLPAMSARYDGPAGQAAGLGAGGPGSTSRGQGRFTSTTGGFTSATGGEAGRPAAAGMWEALSAGSDPTAGQEQPGAAR
jgi:Tryptophan-associated transmembrane protein (Trp_oprn_chp)